MSPVCSWIIFASFLTLSGTVQRQVPVISPSHTPISTHFVTNSSTLFKKEELSRHTYNTKDTHLGCKELRSKRYISDGYCTSIKPITEVVCAGFCLPVSELPWYADYAKRWSHHTPSEWRCVNDVTQRKKVHLLCKNGERRTYKIRIIRSCKCKKYHRAQNRTSSSSTTKNEDTD